MGTIAGRSLVCDCSAMARAVLVGILVVGCKGSSPTPAQLKANIEAKLVQRFLRSFQATAQ
jgi:hypothetical protein